EVDHLADAVRHQQLTDAGQLGECSLGTSVADETAGRVQDLCSAAQGGKTQEQLVLGGLEGRVLEQCLERHEVPRRQRAADGCLHIVRQLDRVHDPLEELRVTDV